MSKSGNATKVGAVLVAVGASACCWLPLLLVGLGAGATGAGAVFMKRRNGSGSETSSCTRHAKACFQSSEMDFAGRFVDMFTVLEKGHRPAPRGQ